MGQDGRKKVIYSGIQPTGVFTLGNYIGAVREWGPLQDKYDCIYCVVDLHALTIRQEPKTYRRQCLGALALLMAAGIDPDRSILYFQSHVPQHAELSWILNCYTYMGELSRMTQYKEKSEKQGDNINAGLFDYPVLMASDILLYNTSYVPVGADQKQHIEITRDIALRFNSVYGNIFTVPDAFIRKEGARIMSLTDPQKKMSKSDDESTYVSMLDEPDVIVKRLKRAVTDSEGGVYASPDKPGVTNLITIYSVLTGLTPDDIRAQYDGRGYGVFKQAVADAVISEFAPVRDQYKRLMDNQDYLSAVAADGAARAEAIASRTLATVHKRIGLVPRAKNDKE